MTKQTSTTEGVEFAQMDPRSLVIGANARVDVKIDRALVESVTEHGVMQAITATRGEDGAVVVLQGQRRTRAAVEAGLPLVPVMIVPAQGDDAERIVRQVEENDRRQAMTGNDRVAVAEQLALMGWSADQIAKRTRREVAEVRDALNVAQSAKVRERMDRDALTLEQAAWLAEWEQDEEATKRLEDVLNDDPARMVHVVARLRKDKAEAEEMGGWIAKVTAACGIEAVAYPCEDAETVGNLRTREGGRITNAEHVACPGNVVMVKRTPQWDMRHNPNAMPYRVLLGCRNHKAHGHATAWEVGHSTRPQQTREERAAIREGNAAWRAANEVRAEWLARFTKAAKMPKGGAEWTAQALANGDTSDAVGWGFITGRTPKRISQWDAQCDELRAEIAKLTGTRAAVAALAMTLDAYEKPTSDVTTWRGTSDRATRYLRQIEAWGYTLSEAETDLCERTERAAAEQ